MADGGNTFRFSGETRNLLRDHSDFFQTFGEALQEAKLNLRGGDDDARSERSFKDDGSVEIVLIFPLDQDEKAENGRLYLRDRFLFDPAQQKLKQFERTFEYNGKGPAAAWTPLMEKLQGWTYFDGKNDEDKKKIMRFASRVARSYSRPITPSVKEVLKDPKHLPYLLTIHEAAVAKNPSWKVKIGDPETHYNLIYQEDATLEVVVSTVVDNDDKPGNGRVFVNDKFILDAKTLAFKDVKRSWSIGRDSRAIPGMEAPVQELNTGEAPDKKIAEDFIQAVVPALLKTEKVDGPSVPGAPSGSGFPPLPGPSALPKDFQSALARRAQLQPVPGDAMKDLQKENLEILKQVAAERLQNQRDRGRGWVSKHFSDPEIITAEKESELLKQWFEEAAKALQPGQDFFQVAQQVELSDEAKLLRKKVLADSFLQQMIPALREPNAEVRARGLMILARETLLKDKQYGASAALIASKLQAVPETKADADRLLAFLSGKGSVGTKFDVLTPIFAREAANPAMLAAMLLAGPASVASEAGSLWALSRLGRFGEIVAPVAAPSVAVLGEAAVFTATHKALEAATRDPNKVFHGYGWEMLSAALLFGAFRLNHWAGGEVNLAMSRGKFGKIFGADGLPAADAILQRGANGRIRLPLNYTEIGAPLPKLTRTGHFANFVLNHVGGVAAIYGAGVLGRLAHLQPANDQALGGHIFDAALFYSQAMLGYNLANRAFGGHLFNSVAEGKLRLEAKRQEARDAKGAKISVPPTSVPGSTEAKAVFHLKVGEKIIDVQVTEDVKRIWLGRSVNETQVVYPSAEEALVSFAGAEEISNQHAMLQQDKSGVWFLGDLGSHYGTYVNGQPVQTEGPIMVRPGDLIRLGDLEFTLDVDGEFIVPPKPKVPKVSFPDLPQVPLPPPDVPDAFPLEEFFKDKIVPKDAKVVIATLISSDGQVELNFYGDKTSWTLPSLEDGKVVAEMYVDKRGRLFVDNDYAGKNEVSQDQFKVNGRAVNQWIFVRDGDLILIGGREYNLQVPKIPFVEATRTSQEPATNGADREGGFIDDRDTGEFANPLAPPKNPPRRTPPPVTAPTAEDAPEDQPTKPRASIPRAITHHEAAPSSPPETSAPPPEDSGPVDPAIIPLTDKKRRKPPRPAPGHREFDASKTEPGVVKSSVTVAEAYSPEFLAKLDEGEPPMMLHIGTQAFKADRQHTSYVLGTQADSNPAKPWQLAVPIEPNPNVANIHAEIAFAENEQFYLFDRITEQGTYLERSGEKPHRLEVNEWASLEDGDKIILGDPADARSVVIIFSRNAFQRERLPTLATFEPMQAGVFPKELLSHLPPDQPAATFKVGDKVWSTGREKTRYVFGQDPGSNSSEDSGAYMLRGSLLSPEHAEVMIDIAGRYWIKDLNSDHGTYLNGERLEPNEYTRLRAKDKIGLGAPEQKHGAYVIEFDHPQYLSWDEARKGSPGPSFELSQPAIALTEEDFEETSVVQPIPAAPPLPSLVDSEPPSHPRPRHASPPPPPPTRRKTPPPPPPADEADFSDVKPDESDFGDLNGALADDAELGGMMPAPSVDQETVRPPSSPIPPRPPARETDEMLDISSQAHIVAETAFGHGLARAKPEPEDLHDPAPVSGVVGPEPVRNENTAVFSLIRGINPEAFGDLAPDIRSTALLGQVFPFLVGTREELHEMLPILDRFPALKTDIRHLETGSHDLLSFFDAMMSPQVREGGKILPEAVKTKADELWAKYWLSGQITRPFSLKSDGRNFSFSSFEKDGRPANTTIAIHLNPGQEASALEAVTRHLLTLEFPIEVTLPIAVGEQDVAYLGINFHSERSEEVYDAVLALAEEYPAIRGHDVPAFFHGLIDRYDREMAGIGVIEKHHYGLLDPLNHRSRLIKSAFSESQKQGNSGGRFEWKKMLPVVLKLFSEKGFDLNQPGFRKGSAESTHEWIVKRSVPPPANDAVLGMIGGTSDEKK